MNRFAIAMAAFVAVAVAHSTADACWLTRGLFSCHNSCNECGYCGCDYSCDCGYSSCGYGYCGCGVEYAAPSCCAPAAPTCCAPSAPSCCAPAVACDTCAPAAPSCCAPSGCH